MFTFALAGAQSYSAMLGLRFVVGLFEAGYWPALYYILGSWYTKRELICKVISRRAWNQSDRCLNAGELGKRNGILQSAVSIAPIFSGFLQAGIYNGLNGHAGLAGWRWLFSEFPHSTNLCPPFTHVLCYSHQRGDLIPNCGSCFLLSSRHSRHC